MENVLFKIGFPAEFHSQTEVDAAMTIRGQLKSMGRAAEDIRKSPSCLLYTSHLVLLDNGRTQAYADEQLRATLQCIRCGACMNHCPVYTRIGGHAYGTTYPGPIGEIISPHMMGLAATHALPTASTLCLSLIHI